MDFWYNGIICSFTVGGLGAYPLAPRSRPAAAGDGRVKALRNKMMRSILRKPKNPQNGFLLPLSIMGALMMFTGLVSLSLADFQSAKSEMMEMERNSSNDQLMSAAQVIAEYLQLNRYRCLRQYKLSDNPTCGDREDTFPKLTAATNEFLNTPYAALPLSSRRITITNWDPKNSGGTSGLLSLATEDGNQKKDFYINFGFAGQRSAISDESQAQT